MRLIRPHVARACVFALGLCVCLPTIASGRPRREPRKQATPRKTTSPSAKKKPAYSASSSAARKARLTRARAAARAREQARLRQLQEVMTPRYKTDESGALVPDVRAAAAIIFNPETGQVLWEENAQDKRSIASITKVMTAMVFLEDNPDLTQEITIERGDIYAASTTYLRANERITLNNVLHLTLIASDNAAARALARVSHGGTAAFVERMNEKALELGLESTTFADPSGLNPENVSSAYDLSRLISFAVGRRAHCADHADGGIQADDEPPHDHHSQHQPPADRRRSGRDGREDRLHLARQATAWPRCSGCRRRRAISRSRSSCSAPRRTWAASGKRRHLFNWLSQKAGDIFNKDQ